MSQLLERLRDHWTGLSCVNRRPATLEEILAFEERCRVRLPPLVREYFATLNGTKEGESSMEDEDLISFWHLDQLQPLEDRPSVSPLHVSSFFLFADWSINAHEWAVQLTADRSGQNTVLIMYDPPQQVAASFEEFVQRYLARDKAVLFPELAARRLPRR